MGKGMEGGGLGLGGVFWVGVCTPVPTRDVCAAEKAAGRSPAEVPHFGLLGSLYGALSASAACLEAKGPVALGCWPGATGSHQDQAQLVCSLSLISECPFRDPISHKPLPQVGLQLMSHRPALAANLPPKSLPPHLHFQVFHLFALAPEQTRH